MKQLIFLFLIIYSWCGNAQVLNNANGEAFTNKPFFNSKFIEHNHVQSIKGQFLYKKSMQGIYPTVFNYVYNFNRKGELISSYETRTDDGTSDTTWNVYQYDPQGNLVIHKTGSNSAKTVTKYIYDSLQHVVSEEYYTESIDTNGIKTLLLINSEKTTYRTFENQLIKEVANSYGLKYKKIVLNYDENDYLLSKTKRFLRTSNSYNYHYTYNDKGLLTSIKTLHNANEIPVKEVRFEYDELGNLLEKHEYKNDVFITDTQIIYNDKTKVMTAVIIRDVKTDFIMIIQFKDYQFFSDKLPNTLSESQY